MLYFKLMHVFYYKKDPIWNYTYPILKIYSKYLRQGVNRHIHKQKSPHKMRAFNVPSAGIEPAQFPIGV